LEAEMMMVMVIMWMMSDRPKC